MSDHNTEGREPRWYEQANRLNWALIVIALVLAFGLGRLWGHHGEPREAEVPPDPPGAKEAKQAAETYLKDHAADKLWTRQEQDEFMASLSGVGSKDRYFLIGQLANKVNNEGLKYDRPQKVATFCVKTCPPGEEAVPGKAIERTKGQ